jgi:hypothetical protein
MVGSVAVTWAECRLDVKAMHHEQQRPIDVELIIREDHKVLEVLGIGTGVVVKSV